MQTFKKTNKMLGSVGSPLLTQLMNKAGIGESEPDLKFNMEWKDLEELYVGIATGFVEQVNAFHMSVQALKDNVYPTTDELTVTINGMVRDIDTLTKELVTIHDCHKDKTGVIDDDGITMMLTLSQDYKTVAARIASLLMPSMITITEYMSEMNNAKQKESLQNPNVVSDVIIKESKTQ
jgi:hypothetical protein